MKYLLLFVLFLHLNKANSLIDIETYEMEIEKTRKTIILLIILSLNYFKAEELVQEIVERFDKIAETTVDFTEKLKLIKDTSASFLKLAVPLGSLLAASLDIIKKPESDEYKALKKMNAHMVYQFDRLNERITYSFEAEEMDTELREFNIVSLN
uniref:Secreted protein n=1 Tax=Meloidogyne hapla TaxID=6305 RepID=A0A1I8BCK0_MELHA